MDNKSNKKKRPVIYLRVTEEELSYIEKIANERGEKVNSYAKSCLLNKAVHRPLMPQDSCNKIVTELKRIGNNFNQIARHLNSGFRKGWHSSFEECSDDISKIRELLVSHVSA